MHVKPSTLFVFVVFRIRKGRRLFMSEYNEVQLSWILIINLYGHVGVARILYCGVTWLKFILNLHFQILSLFLEFYDKILNERYIIRVEM